jgi:hypothetical protein
MNIKGAEGMSPEQIRDEIHRGGRVVVYTYCVSILIMTFKRPAGMRLIRANSNAAANSWPYLLISLLFGWWGFPWGPIYTVETIYRNLCGGIDLTDAVLRDLQPLTQPGAETATPTKPAPMPAKPSRFDGKVAGILAGGVAAAAVLGITVFCLFKKNDLTLVLVSGLDRPYEVTLNGTPHQLKPHGTEVLHLAEGEFILEDAPGGQVVGPAQKFNFSAPLFDHLTGENVAIVNPDQTAILINTEIPYYADGTSPPADEKPAYSLAINQAGYFLPKPEFVFETPDARTSMPSGVARVVKHRLYALEPLPATDLTGWLTKQSGYDAVREHLQRLARQRSDEDLLNAAIQSLKPDDLRTFFRARLADRPVLVDWHRFYQQQMERHFPRQDLLAEYQAYLRAEPANGALMYLVGRQVEDPVEQTKWWQAALAANPACNYAYSAMAYDDLSDARFEDARNHCFASLAKGINTGSLQYNHRMTYLALGRAAEYLPQLTEARKKNPQEITLAEQEMVHTYLATHDLAKVRQVKATYLKAYQATHPSAENLADADAYLEACLCYQAGDFAAYAKSIARFDQPFYRFRAAFVQEQLETAAKAQAEEAPDPDAELLLYLLAHQKGDAAAADKYFLRAMAAMKADDRDFRHIAAQIESGHPDAADICRVTMPVERKRIVLAALGARYPVEKPTYFNLARKLNFNPEFPQHFLKTVLAQ